MKNSVLSYSCMHNFRYSVLIPLFTPPSLFTLIGQVCHFCSDHLKTFFGKWMLLVPATVILDIAVIICGSRGICRNNRITKKGKFQKLCKILLNQVFKYHQEISATLAWPDRFDNTKSGWCHIVNLYVDLAKVEIMAMDLPTYISGYHWDITRPSLVILMKTWSNFINAVQNLGIIYNYLYLACIWMSKWWYFAIHCHFGKDCY